MILETIENQYGETVETYCLTFTGKNWVAEYLTCFSSELVNMGTCQCHSHNAFSTEKVSREEVRKMLKNHHKESELSFEEREDLYNTDIDKKVSEKLGLDSIAELEQWLSLSYKMGINPLPKLRGFLKDICEVFFTYSSDYACFYSDDDGNYLVISLDDSDDDYRVDVAFY